MECVWAPELFRSAATQAAYLAAKTTRIDVATGIVWAFTRSPFIHAVTALDIDEMSGGRFRLGMGPGSSASTKPGTTPPTANRRRICARRSRRRG